MGNKILDFFKSLRPKYLLIVSGLFGILLFGYLRACDKKKDVINSAAVLQPNEEEALVIDPVHHRITVIKPGSTRTMALPDRPTRIFLMKGDGIQVVAPQWGTEIRPFLIGAYDLSGGKLGIGTDLFYYKRFDIGGGLVINPVRVQDTVLFVGVSYFVVSNTSVTLGITNQGNPLIGIKVRL